MNNRVLVSRVRTACSSSLAAAVGRTMRTGGSKLVLALTVFVAVGPSPAISFSPVEIFVVSPAPPAVVRVDASSICLEPANNGCQVVVSSGGNLAVPSDIAIAGDDLLVADPDCCGGQGGIIRVSRVDGSQTIVSSGGNFGGPVGLAVAGDGAVLVVDPKCCGGAGGIIQVDPLAPPGNNQKIVSLGGGLPNASGIAVAANGDLYVADRQGSVIQVNPLRPAADNQVLFSFGNLFSVPVGIAFDASGNLLVTDESCCLGGNGGIIQVSLTNGTPTIVAQGGNFARPQRVASDAAGDLFVADSACCTGNVGGVIGLSGGSQTVISAGDNIAFPLGIAVDFTPSRPPNACGGTVPCACGDLVVRDRTLRGSDPVTRTACPADGLVVADGVTLDLGGATLRGQGTGAGVRIEAGATNVTVRRGKITGFATGVRGQGTGTRLTSLQILDHVRDGVILTGDGHTVAQALVQGNGGLGVVVLGNANRLVNLQVRNNARAGVRVVGNGNRLEQSAIEGNGEHGAEVSGDLNQVQLLRVQGNRGDGVFLTGTGNTASRNSALGNGADGLEIRGAGATLDRNRATSNGEAGLEIHGTGHAVTQNIAGLNAGTGLEMVGTTESRFDRNRGENNRGFGIADDSAGGGTGGTANIYTGNRCGRGNGAGASSPAGLCH